MAAPAHLLPPNATALEIAIDTVDAARSTLPTALVSAVWDPDRCPADQLGYLAWALSVDLWDDGWDGLKKRDVCRRSFALHRLKTTPAGIRAHVAIAGSTVVKITRPPATCFARTSITPEAREAWLDRLPQIRVYPFAVPGRARRRVFAGGRVARRSFMGHGWLRPVRASELLGPRATLYDRGVERALPALIDIGGGANRVCLPSVRPRTLFYGHGFCRGWLRRTDAAASVVTFRIDRNAGEAPIARGLAAASVCPTRIAAPRAPRLLGSADDGGVRTVPLGIRHSVPEARAFANRFRGFMMTSHAPNLLFDRIALQDPDRLPARRHTRAWYGRSRFGVAPYTAELRIAVPMRRARRRGFRWHGVGFLRSADLSALTRARAAVSVSKAARDTILIDTATMTRPIFGRDLRFGTFTFGERTRKH